MAAANALMHLRENEGVSCFPRHRNMREDFPILYSFLDSMVYLVAKFRILLASPSSSDSLLVCRLLSMSGIQLDSGITFREYTSPTSMLGEARISWINIMLNSLVFNVASSVRRFAIKF